MGRLKLEGRVRDHVAAILLVAVVMGGAWRLGLLDALSADRQDADRRALDLQGDDGDGDESADAGGDEPDDAGDVTQRLETADYEPGDCVDFPIGVAGMADTDVVPCTEDHRMQMTERVELDFESSEYPSGAEWDEAIAEKCTSAAAGLLGRPLDPSGRFFASAIYPLVESWEMGDRSHMWCGIGSVGSLDGTGDDEEIPRFAEDVRDADPGFHHPVGSCLFLTEVERRIVECAEPHTLEVAGEIDLSGRDERPVGAQERALNSDCQATTRSYLGADPVAPWGLRIETLSEESWAAGTRSVHCYVAQSDAAGNLVEVSGSAKS